MEENHNEYCSYCGALLAKDASFCEHCSKPCNQDNNSPQNPISTKECSHCGNKIPLVAKICPHCKTSFTPKKASKKQLLFVICIMLFWIFVILSIFGKNTNTIQSGDTSQSLTQTDEIQNKAAEEKEGTENAPVFNPDEYRASCQKKDYTDICRNPKMYEGTQIVFKGKVIQVQERSKYCTYRIATKEVQYLGYTDNIFYVEYKRESDDESRILENDMVTIYGELKGLKKYTTVLGSQIQIPYVNAVIIDINK